MNLEFWHNQHEIVKSVERYRKTCIGIDSVVYVPMEQSDAERILDLERKSIDRSNKRRDSWLGNLLCKRPQRYLLIHSTGIPNDPNSTYAYPESTPYITSAEVYPPFPDIEQNEMVVAGLYEVLNAIDVSNKDDLLKQIPAYNMQPRV